MTMQSHGRPLAPLVLAMVLAGVPAPAMGQDVVTLEMRPGELVFETVRLVNNLNEGCAVADVNNDGQLDVIAGPCWYEGPMWRQHLLRHVPEIGNEFASNNADHAFDVNGDGWVDVIAASWFSPDIFWYENPGRDGLRKGALWKAHKIAGDKGECEGILLEDLDGDGTPELIPNHWKAQRPVTVFRIVPGRDGQPPAFKPFNAAEKGNDHGMAVGDINGDGRKDIVLSHGWLEAPATGDIATGKWIYHEAFGVPHLSVPGVVTDVNSDGLNDVIFGHGHNYGLMWFEQHRNTDGKSTWTQHLIDESFSQVHCLAWADLDGDGRGELITGKRWRAHKGADPGSSDPILLKRYVWNAGTGQFDGQVISQDEGIGTGMQIRIADMDGDKRPDIVVAGKTGTYILFNRGTAGGRQASRFRVP